MTYIHPSIHLIVLVSALGYFATEKSSKHCSHFFAHNATPPYRASMRTRNGLGARFSCALVHMLGYYIRVVSS